MPRPDRSSALADPGVRAALARDLDAQASPRATRLVDALVRDFGTSTVALLHYGSHAHRSDARPESAHDFFVIVDDYLSAYRHLASTAGMKRQPRVAALLNRVLAPNVIAVADPHGSPPLLAKCAVLTLRDFRRACSARAADHFVRGRLFQPAQLLWARDTAHRRMVTDAVLDARAGAFAWGRAALPPRFDAETFCRALLARSFAAEIRPETADRLSALLDAQRATIVPMYAALLRWLSREGVVTVAQTAEGTSGTAVGDGALMAENSPASPNSVDMQTETYADPQRVGPVAGFRSAAYFQRSKLRATMRWVKYALLYDDWLEYVLQKVARRSGTVIELTDRERRWPFIFLWPKVIRFLRTRPQRRG